MDPRSIPLLERIEDRRVPTRKSIIIFSPVGDLGQLETFCAHARSLGLDKQADFVFVYRKGLDYGAHGLSALHAAEKYPLGTSGAFFAGQLLSYSLGYETIAVADLDAFLDSRATFDALVRIAQEKKSAAVPLSKNPQEKKPQPGYAVMNQWGVFPRCIFEECGFAIPYTYKGAEDFELKQRLLHAHKLAIYSGGAAIHPKEGIGVFHKLANRRKYFPYVAGLMKAYLFCSIYAPLFYLKYLLWHSYYSFFADAFGELQLARVLSSPFGIKQLNSLSDLPPCFGLEQLKGKSPPSPADAVLSLLPLLLFKRATPGDCKITLLLRRPLFALFLAKAVLLAPIRLLQGISCLLSQRKAASNLTFPIFPKNAFAAAETYISLINR